MSATIEAVCSDVGALEPTHAYVDTFVLCNACEYEGKLPEFEFKVNK